MIIHIEWLRVGRHDCPPTVLNEQQLRRRLVGEALLIFQAATQHERVHARYPLMVPASNGKRMLVFVKPEMGAVAFGRIVILKIVSRMVILVFDQGQQGIVRGYLLLHGG